jgi:hypothetical protein
MGTPRSQSKIQPNFPDSAARLLRHFMPRNRPEERDCAPSGWQISSALRYPAQGERVRARSSRSAASQKSYAAA